MSTCPYCHGALDQIDVSTFGGERRHVDGRCAARCRIPRCVTCDGSLTPDHRCTSLDCPVAFVIQPVPVL